jgi:predicted HAD superfamily hydrolase
MAARDDATFTAALAFGLMRRRHIENASGPSRRQLVDVGYDTFGPAMAGWFLWLQRRIAEIAPRKVLLFARDARLVNRLVAEGDLSFGDAQVEYVYVSRYALSFAAIRVLEARVLEILFRRFQGQTIRQFLELWFEFSPERLQETGFPRGLDPQEPIAKALYPALTHFIHENQSHFLSAAREHRDRAGLYLATMLKDEKTVLVDIGWNGNMQSDWHNAVATAIRRDHVEGLYFALFPSAELMIKRGHRMEGWYWQPHIMRKEFDMLQSGGTGLLELALSAYHGTTLGYDAQGRPILDDSAEDRDYQASCLNIQTGITAFWNDLRALCPDRELALQSGHPDEWMAPLCRLVMKPSAEESELLGDIRHSVEGGKAQPFALAPKMADPAARPERVIWRPGFAVRNGLFPIF